MELDKETLIKHRFWIALGVFVPLWLLVWCVEVFSVSDDAKKAKDDYDKSAKAVEAIKNPKTDAYTLVLKDKEKSLQKSKDEVWEKVWETQRPMQTWPWKETTETLMRLNQYGAPFGSEIGSDERREYRDSLYTKYVDDKRKEIHGLAGPVAFSWDKIINPVKEWKQLPTSEECWYAQEDLWVKTEIFRALDDALKSLARFQEVKMEPAPVKPAGVVSWRRFRNSNWELDLKLEKGERNQLFIHRDSTIKNINAAKRTLPLREVWIMLSRPGDQVSFLIQGNPVPWNGEHKIDQRMRIDQHGFLPDGQVQVDQFFTWGTSPVKQVEDLRLGYQSHRTSFQDYKPRYGQKEEAAPAAGGGLGAGGAAGAGAGGGAGGPAGMPSFGNSGPPSGALGGGLGGGGGSSNLTVNGLEKARYIQGTPQVRRMPIGIVLVADQAYVQDVLTAFSNSKLRFQITQVSWHQEERVLRPPDQADGGGRGGAGQAGGPEPVAGPGMMANMMRMPTGAVAGGAGMAAKGGAGQGLGAGGGGQIQANLIDEADPNLVEVSIYGIASLYERYQPSGEQQPAGAAQQQPAAGQQQPAPAQGGQQTPAPPAADQQQPQAPPPAGAPAPKGEDKGAPAPKGAEEPKKADDVKKADEPKGK